MVHVRPFRREVGHDPLRLPATVLMSGEFLDDEIETPQVPLAP